MVSFYGSRGVRWSGRLVATPLHHFAAHQLVRGRDALRVWGCCSLEEERDHAGASIAHRDVEVEQRPTIYVLYTWLIIAAGGAPFLPFLVPSFGSAWKVSALS